MIIVIDLDNTLFFNDVTYKVSQKYGLLLPTEYDLSCYPKFVSDECFEMFRDADAMHNLKPYEGAREVLSKWAKEGHELYCVTARSHCFTDRTRAMVNEHYPMIKDTILCESFDKSTAFKMLKADLIIDDHFDYLPQACNVGVKHTYMISNEHTPYNHKYAKFVRRTNGCRVFDSVASVILPMGRKNV